MSEYASCARCDTPVSNYTESEGLLCGDCYRNRPAADTTMQRAFADVGGQIGAALESDVRAAGAQPSLEEILRGEENEGAALHGRTSGTVLWYDKWGEIQYDAWIVSMRHDKDTAYPDFASAFAAWQEAER